MKNHLFAFLIAVLTVSSAVAKTNPGVSADLPERSVDDVASLTLIGSNLGIGSSEYAEVTLDDGKLYISGNTPDIQIIDVSSPSSITQLGVYNGELTYGLGVSGNTAVVSGDGDFSGFMPFYVLDVSDPSSLSQVGSGSVSGLSDIPAIVSVEVFGTTAALLAKDGLGYKKIEFYDISTPSSPILITSMTPPANVESESEFYRSGTRLYQTGTYSTGIIDISNPANPVSLGSASHSDGFTFYVRAAGDESNLFTADDEGVVRFYDVTNPSPSSPAVQTGSLNTGLDVKDLWVVGDYLLVLAPGQLDVYYTGRAAQGELYLTGTTSDFDFAHHVLGEGNNVYILENDYTKIYDASAAYVPPAFPVINYTETVTSGFPEVQCSFDVTSVSDSNTPYTGLTSDNFTLTENQISQTISVEESTPGSYVLTYTTEDLTGQGQSRDLHLVLTYEGDATDSVDVTYIVPVVDLTLGDVDVSEFPSISFSATVVNESSMKISGLSSSNFSVVELFESETEATVSSVEEQADSTYIVTYDTENFSHTGSLRDIRVTADINGLQDSEILTFNEPAIDPALSLSLVDGLINFPTVMIALEVTDEVGLPVTGLAASDFTVEENSVVQEDVTFEEAGEGYYILSHTSSNALPDGTNRVLEYTVSNDGLSDSISLDFDAPLPPSLTIGDGEAVLPTVADVPITVADFGNVSVMEFYINYDPTKVTFENITSDVAEGIVFNATDGNLILSWFSTNPLYLDDGDTLLTMHFATDGFSGVGVETTPVSWLEGSYLANFDATLFPGVVYTDGSVTGLSIADINGSISYFTSEIALEGATVALSGDTTLSVLTDETGAFSFADILPGNYTVTPSLSDEGHTGVNTLDAYRIQRSLDELNPFTSGYELFASDVNLSANVNTMDAYLIQRRVVGMDETFDAGEWAFISSSYGMTLENWAEADLERSFSLMGIDSTAQDFFGVRIGDANNTWPNLFLDLGKTDELTGSLTIADAVVGPGRTTTVELQALGLGEIGALEWHLEFNPEVVTLQDYDLPGIGGALVTTTDSTINVSWFNVASAMNCDARILGYLTFQAIDQVNVESDLHLYDVVLGNDEGEELWTDVQDGTITVANTMGLNYQGAELVTDWELRPSYPNPFNAYTTLSFDVKDASEVQIHVYNILGDLVTTLVQGSLPKGRYTSSVNAQNWSSGTYFVVMKTQSFNKVQKIVLLK